MYRFLVALIDPLLLCLLALGMTLVCLWRCPQVPRGRLRAAMAAFLALVLICMPPVVFLALGTLEWAYPPRYDIPRDAQALVVLGGRVNPPDTFRPRPVLEQETVTRCRKVAQLYRENGPRLVVVSGGNVDPRQPGPTCAEAMSEFLVHLGVAPGDLITEGQSRTTYENASKTQRLLSHRGITRIVLVTSATHLRRSERCFRAVGFQVTPRGCGYRATKLRWTVRSLLPNAGSAQRMGDVVHEWVGLAWYWLRGRI